jgi:hypothetical protein
MMMLNSDDWTQMASDLVDIRDDNVVSVVLRRGSSSLDAQSVRVARSGARGGARSSEGAEEQRGQVLVAGDTSLDIEVGDRFTYGGILYRVTFVRPNQRAGIMAEAEAVE